jgi:hypothetical protein
MEQRKSHETTVYNLRFRWINVLKRNTQQSLFSHATAMPSIEILNVLVTWISYEKNHVKLNLSDTYIMHLGCFLNCL